ncbi:VOC family protein [uncultured Tateyamaria sp.]|nr:VOC family protein [uncultured Tateyamaria sp.]
MMTTTAKAQEFDLTFNNVAISVSDLDESIAFYRDILGFEVVSQTYFEPVSAKVAFIALADVRLELLEVEGSERLPELDTPPPTHLLTQGFKAIVFDVNDLSGFTQYLNANEVETLWEELVLDDAGSTSTLFRDPDGNLINVFGVSDD